MRPQTKSRPQTNSTTEPKQKQFRVASAEAYALVDSKLGEKDQTLVISVEDFLETVQAAKTPGQARLGSYCNVCEVFGTVSYDNLKFNNHFQACRCNGQLPLSSREYYYGLTDKLEETRWRILVLYDEYKTMKLTCRSSVPVQCNECEVVNELKLGQFAVDGQTPGCFCPGSCLRVASRPGFDRLVAKLEPTRLRFTLDFEQFLALRPKRDTKLSVHCTGCDTPLELHIGHFLYEGKLPPCFCPGGKRPDWSSDLGKAKLKQLVEASRFSFVHGDDAARFGHIADEDSRLELKCNVCAVVVTPDIYHFLQGKVGCGCQNSTELKVLRFLEGHVDGTPLRVVRQFQFEDLIGVGGRVLSYDLAVLRPDGSVLLLVEVDGGHHFDPHFSYGPSHQGHTFEHDRRKERRVVDDKLFLARLCQRTAERDSEPWQQWLGNLISTCPVLTGGRIFRLSHTASYSKGPYRDVRRGSLLEF